MSSLNNIPSFPKDCRLKGTENYLQFKSFVISAVRSKGLMGYLDGSIPQPATTTASQLLAQSTTALNSVTPTLNEWFLHEGHVSGLIYQNIEDSEAHGIKPELPAAEMWSSLKAKFEVTSQIHRNIALKKLESLTYSEDEDFSKHLKKPCQASRSCKHSWL
ncbi:hypothetical protein V5O48_017202 [Marasmius crinis-equi]|uniref:Uncharacterized protein n=1 Tax=Marasmius crinis-equi TaxID=585013 RepID=A0ABR3EPM7_9AGAR